MTTDDERAVDRPTGRSPSGSAFFERSMADALPHIVWVAHPSGELEFTNVRWKAYMGAVSDVARHVPWRSVFHPEDHDRFLTAWSWSLTSQLDMSVEARMRRADGTYRWHLVRAVAMREGGRVTGWLGTATDIEEQKAAHTELQRLHAALEAHSRSVEAEVDRRTAELQIANARLHDADRYKDEFLSVISHELRTPLNFIFGFVSLLEDGIYGDLTPAQLDALTRVSQGSERMLGLVEDLLDFARIQAGKISLQLEPADYPAVVQEASKVAEGLSRQKQLTLETVVPVLGPVTMDSGRIGQVLNNLISNAVKFTRAGGHIAINVFERDDCLITEVRDTGCGIAPNDLDRLFQRFSQLDMSPTRRSGGTGLGLAISKALIEGHGGRIGVRSEPGSGSTFWFSLPYSG